MCAFVLLAFSTPWLVTPTRAQDVAPSSAEVQQSALARALFEEGVALGDAGDWPAAADRFGRAYSLRPTSNVAFNWASALIETQRLLQAQELLLRVQRDEAADPAVARACREQLAALAVRIPRVRIEVPTQRDVVLEVDGAPWPRAAWGVASPLDPGEHVARLLEQTRELAREEFTLRERELRTLTLQPTPQGDDDSEGARKRRRWALWTGVGVLAAGGVVTAVLLATRHDGDRSPVSGNAQPGVLRW